MSDTNTKTDRSQNVLSNMTNFINNNTFLDKIVYSGNNYGIPYATYGMVGISLGVFLYATLTDAGAAIGQSFHSILEPSPQENEDLEQEEEEEKNQEQEEQKNQEQENQEQEQENQEEENQEQEEQENQEQEEQNDTLEPGEKYKQAGGKAGGNAGGNAGGKAVSKKRKNKGKRKSAKKTKN